jgi:hypothetical protein
MPVSPPAPCAVYVYYRVPVARQDEALSRVHTLFQSLRTAWPDLQARLMHKVDATEAVPSTQEPTWMEVYEHPLGVGTDCLAQMQKLAQTLLADQTGPRHIELFAPAHLPGGGLA